MYHPDTLSPLMFDQEVDETTSSQSSEATSNSPLTPFQTPRPMSASSGSETHPDESKSLFPPREKRKRSRVTPDQLVRLENFFAIDRSPTASRRREISLLLGMQERQTQIWFQNRRAKAKQLESKQLRPRPRLTTTLPPSPDSTQVDIQALVHEDAPFSLISCKDLSIGTWRRIISLSHQKDLVAYVCYPKRCLTWFIHSSGYGFKMEIPFNTVKDLDLMETSPGEGLLVVTISEAPMFFMENSSSPPNGGAAPRDWKRSTDWTEDNQASTVFQHHLGGEPAQLNRFVHDLQPYLLNRHASPSSMQHHYGPIVDTTHGPNPGYLLHPHHFEIVSPQPTGYPSSVHLHLDYTTPRPDTRGSPSTPHSAPASMPSYSHPHECGTPSSEPYGYGSGPPVYQHDDEQYPLSAYPDVNISSFARGFPATVAIPTAKAYYSPVDSPGYPIGHHNEPQMEMHYPPSSLEAFSPDTSTSSPSSLLAMPYQPSPSPLV